MHKSIIFWVLIGLSIQSYAQLNEKYTYQHFSGSIGQHTKINLHLCRFGNDLSSTYEIINGEGVKDAPTEISLKGDYNIAGNLVKLWAASDSKNNLFTGKYSDSKHITGEWCIREGEEKFSFKLTEDYSMGQIPFKYEVYADKMPLFAMKGSPEGKILMLFPVPQQRMGQDAFVRHLSGVFSGKKDILPSELKEELKVAANQFFTAYLDNNREAYNIRFPNSTFCWEREQTAIIILNKKDLVSIRYKNFAFTGGKAGLEQNKVFTFDFKGIAPISLRDLFQDEDLNGLSDAITETLIENLGLTSTETLKSRGFYSDNISAVENFYLGNEGISFVYNPYEIAGGSHGITEVYIEYSKIHGLLKSRSVVERLINRDATGFGL
ncbi:MAG: RsiV family protein [Bacteroidales bacterium]|nr:RsiV family protein [Bacteroidales bacterium]